MSRRSDVALRCVMITAGAMTAGILLLIATFVVFEAWGVIAHRGIGAFLGSSWNPSKGNFGLMPMLLGSLAILMGSLILAIPMGILAAIACRWYLPRLGARSCRAIIAVLAGLPSVVLGWWGLVQVVPLINRIEPPGASLLAGCIVLAIMVTPTVALTTDAAFGAVPAEQLRGAAALALSHWTTLRTVVWPAARGGIAAGIILAAGRALGETMVVVMVCGNVVQVPTSLFAPVRTLTANIALEMAYAMDDHRGALFVGGLALLLLIALLMAIGHVMSNQRSKAAYG